MGEIRIKSWNLFDINGERTSLVWDGKECLVVENDAIIVNQIRPGYMTGIYYDKEYKEGTYTLIIQVDSSQFINKQVRLVSSAPFLGGAWNEAYQSYTANMNKQDALHYISFTVNEPTKIGFFVNGHFESGDKLVNIQLLEGTYTSETIPEYQPYFLNRPAHQFTNGEWIDIPTHHYTNGRWQGELTSQSPLKFRADGAMLDWRVEGKTSGNLWDGTLVSTTTMGVTFRLDNDGYMYASPTNSDTRGWTYAYSQIKVVLPSGHYTLCLSGTPSTYATSGIRVNDDANNNLGNIGGINGQSMVVINFAVTDNHNIGIVAKINDGRFRVQLLEGTYTSSTIPPYEPYGGVGDYDETEQKYVVPVRVEGENLVESVTSYPSTSIYVGSLLIEADLKPDTQYTFAFKLTEGYEVNWNSNLFTTSSPITAGKGDELIIVTKTTKSAISKDNTDQYNSSYGGWLITKKNKTEATTGIYTDVQLLEGTYTADTLPPYEVNLYTDHQLMDGDSIDFTTDQTTIPLAMGNNTLTIDTAVKPSKVFVKFEG